MNIEVECCRCRFPYLGNFNFSNPLKFPQQALRVSTWSRGFFRTAIARAEASSSSNFSYNKFVQIALEETGKRTHLKPSSLQEKFGLMGSMDGETELQMLAYESPKIRLFRSLSIDGGNEMQVLDLAIFPRPEFDLPIFCANFFTTSAVNIVVLDLNPLHDVISRHDYKQKYYKHLIPLGVQYSEIFPWGGKITTESMNFFSPIIIWSKFAPSLEKHHTLCSAFKDYLEAWLKLMDQVVEETDILQVASNLEAQHRYLLWRAEKDPGCQLLRRLVGETHSKEIIRSFLFNGVQELGNRTFTDYFLSTDVRTG